MNVLLKEHIPIVEKHLSKSDKVMERLISEYGPCPLAKRQFRPFHTLTRAIISQQLSSKAAANIERKVSQIVQTPFKPEAFLTVPPNELRSAGVSKPKARYILELAARVADGRLSFAKLKKSADEDIITCLTELPGIGRWTAEMFLIFGLKRADVLSLGDAGLQRAAKMLYGHLYKNEVLETVSTAWRPYRSVASWYLWRHLDNG